MKRWIIPGSQVFSKGVSLILIFCFIGAVLLLLTASQFPRHSTQPTIVAITQSVTPDETETATNSPTESEVTNGIILAGALLIVVIILGTLHATWGLKKTPNSH